MEVEPRGDVVPGGMNRFSDGWFNTILAGDFDRSRFVVGLDAEDAIDTIRRVRYAFLTAGAGHALNRQFVALHGSGVLVENRQYSLR